MDWGKKKRKMANFEVWHKDLSDFKKLLKVESGNMTFAFWANQKIKEELEKYNLAKNQSVV